MTKHYRYLVAYTFQGGGGRVVISGPNALDSEEMISQTEEGIRERSPELERLFINNIVLLREWSE